MPIAVNLIFGTNSAFFAVSGYEAKNALITGTNTGQPGCWEVELEAVWYRIKFSETNSDKRARETREREAREREAARQREEALERERDEALAREREAALEAREALEREEARARDPMSLAPSPVRKALREFKDKQDTVLQQHKKNLADAKKNKEEAKRIADEKRTIADEKRKMEQERKNLEKEKKRLKTEMEGNKRWAHELTSKVL
jgi:hypothetical protein